MRVYGALLELDAWACCAPLEERTTVFGALGRIGRAPVCTDAAKRSLRCENCGQLSVHGRLGDKGSEHACQWFCGTCWDAWGRNQVCTLKFDTVSTPTPTVAPGVCVRCGRSIADTMAPTCPGCWLLEDARANPFENLHEDNGWLAQAMLFADMTGAQPTASELVHKAEGSLTDCAHGHVQVFFDGGSRGCVAIVHALLHAFSGLCCFIDTRDTTLVDEALACDPGIERKYVIRPGGVSAVLSFGVFITRIEEHPKLLLFELRYNALVTLPRPDDVERLEREHFAPLRGICAELEGRRDWWLDRRAIAVVSRAMQRDKFCVIDNFLPDDVVDNLLVYMKSMRAAGEVERGNKQQSYYEQDINADPADMMNKDNIPRKWAAWDDNITFCGNSDPRAKLVHEHYTPVIDRLVTRLRDGIETDGCVPGVSERMRTIVFREETMPAYYLQSTRGRYQRHIDSQGGAWRWLSAVFYLNHNWRCEDGGINRLYEAGRYSTHVKYEVLPIANRLFLLWGEEDCPHEICAVKRDRYAINTFFADGPSMFAAKLHLDTPAALAEVNRLPGMAGLPKGVMEFLHQFFPIEPLSVSDALRRSGIYCDTADRLDRLHSFVSNHRLQVDEQSHVAMLHCVARYGGVPDGPDEMQVARGPRECGHCRAVTRTGRWGVGPFEGSWYCGSCWSSWD